MRIERTREIIDVMKEDFIKQVIAKEPMFEELTDSDILVEFAQYINGD